MEVVHVVVDRSCDQVVPDQVLAASLHQQVTRSLVSNSIDSAPRTYGRGEQATTVSRRTSSLTDNSQPTEYTAEISFCRSSAQTKPEVGGVRWSKSFKFH